MPLHPQAAQFLADRVAENAPAWNELPLEEARQIFDGLTDFYGVGPELDRIEDLETPDGISLRLYQKSNTEQTPVVMYFHGGGFVLGSIQSHDVLCRRLAFESGLTVVSVDYRRAPEHVFPAAFDDCYRSTEFVVGNAEELRVDGQRVILAGDSAGGGLAAAVALKSSDLGHPAILGQVLIYPVLNDDFKTKSYSRYATDYGLTRGTMTWFWQCYLSGESAAAKEPTEPYAAVLQCDSFDMFPKTHVLLAEYDVLHDEGLDFVARLQAAHVPVTSKTYDGMIHGFVHFSEPFDHANEALQDVAEVCRRMVSDDTSSN